ncbi:methyltransferase [Sulfolobus sp. SCGC AB-777_L09]|nr:methyltransferase [Sulfolobus sp. SCGC AB-777_L09]
MNIVTDVVDGIPLVLESTSGLFSKDKLDLGTRILLENLILPESGTVADVGCGYGPIGIFIALKNPNLKVYMLDVDKKAVYFSSRNVKRYKLDDRVFVIRSDIFSALPKEVKFNGIYSNPPLKAGKEFIIRLANESHERLEKGGITELVVYKGEENVINEFKKYFDSKILKREKGYSIILAVKY